MSGTYNRASRAAAFVVALSCAACTTTGTVPAGVDTSEVTRLAVDSTKEAIRERPIVIGKTAELTYFNSKSFDIDLSDTMRSKVEEIRLSIPSPFPVDKIPDGLDQWFYAIKKGGGRVVAEAIPTESQSRGIAILLVELAIPLLKAMLEPDRHAGAEHYDAKLLYDKPTGAVQTIIFTVKRPQV